MLVHTKTTSVTQSFPYMLNRLGVNLSPFSLNLVQIDQAGEIIRRLYFTHKVRNQTQTDRGLLSKFFEFKVIYISKGKQK